MRTRRRTNLRFEKLEQRDVPALFTVGNINDAGAGSFRQAILDANAHSGADQIRFTITGSTATIHLLSALPAITDTVDIDAAIPKGNTPVPPVELDGSAAGANADAEKAFFSRILASLS